MNAKGQGSADSPNNQWVMTLGRKLECVLESTGSVSPMTRPWLIMCLGIHGLADSRCCHQSQIGRPRRAAGLGSRAHPRERSRNVSWNHRFNRFRTYRGLTDGRRFGRRTVFQQTGFKGADCAARAKSVVVQAARAPPRERSRNVSRNQRFNKFRTYRGLGGRGKLVQQSGCKEQNLKG